MRMKHIRKIYEYTETLAYPKKAIKRRISDSPIKINSIIKKIIERYNSLITKKNTSESLEDNLGISGEYLDRLKSEFPGGDIEAAMQDSTEVVRLLTAIRQSESQLSDTQKKRKAMEIVEEIFSGKGFDISKIKFNLHMVNDEDLSDIKNNVIGKSPAEFKEIKKEIRDENPKLAKEIDIRAIQNALTQGFAAAIKDDFVMGDTEIQGVSFGDYYDFMKKTYGLYSKIPSEMIHQILTGSQAIGRVELKWNENTNRYEIDAHGYTILVLVHEMVKGIYELISFNRDPKLSDDDDKKMMDLSGTQYNEREGLQFGPGLVNTFKEFFTKVEDNLLNSRQIEHRNPTIIANVLARLYTLEDDLFLRICSSIFTDSEEDNKPYDLFEQYYMDAIDGIGFSRGDSNEPDEPTSPQIPTDDSLRDLLSGAGISLNMDPSYENLKHVNSFNIFSLLEGYKEQLELWKTQGNDLSTITSYINQFQRLISGAPSELKKELLTANLPIDVPNNYEDRINIEKYRNFDDLKQVVNNVRRMTKLKNLNSLKIGDISPAILKIQEILNLPQTGYFGSSLSDKIKEFQVEFGNKFSEEYNWRELAQKLEDGGIKELTPEDKIKLSKSAEFITHTQEIIDALNNNAKELSKKLKSVKDRDIRRDITAEFTSELEKMKRIKANLKIIKSVFSGGLVNPSGSLDKATISAFMHDKNLTELEGIGGAGTLKQSGGSIVLSTPNYKVYRNESHNFCVETRKDFEKVLRELGAPSEAYNWCISWSGKSHYRGFRQDVAGTNKQTIYFIENVKRTEYEMEKWKEYADRDDADMGSLSGTARSSADSVDKKYLAWRIANDRAISQHDANEILIEDARRYYDNFHIAVVFVNNKKLPNGENSFWCVGASNNGQWGDLGHFSFEEMAKRIWPSRAHDSIRDIGRHSTTWPVEHNIQVPQEIIDQPWYNIPSETEMENLKNNILIPVELSEIEKGGHGIELNLNTKDPGEAFVDRLSYEDKEKWLTKNWTSVSSVGGYLKNRNENPLPLNYWKVLPDELKELYITKTFSQLTPEMFNEIKDNNKLVKVYTDFLNRRLAGEQGVGGLMELLKSNGNDSDFIRKTKNNLLNRHELELMNYPLNTKDLKKDIKKLNIQIQNAYDDNLKPSKVDGLIRERKAKGDRLAYLLNIPVKYENTIKQLINDSKAKITAKSDEKLSKFVKDLSKHYTLSRLYNLSNYIIKPIKSSSGEILDKPFDDKTGEEWLDERFKDDDYKIHISSSKIDMNEVTNLFNKAKTDTKWKIIADKLLAKLVTSNSSTSDFTEKGSYYEQIRNVFDFIVDINDPIYASKLLTYIVNYYDFQSELLSVDPELRKKLTIEYNKVWKKYQEHFKKTGKFKEINVGTGKRKNTSSKLGYEKTGDTERLG